MKYAGKPLMLLILDGWGMPEHGAADCFDLAQVPNYDRLWASYPHTTLGASGMDVGLPEGQMGDSEVGHMNIGAGRVVFQDYTHISREIAEGRFFENRVLIEAFTQAVNNGKAVHIMGLTSDGGIHAHVKHLFALIEMAKQNGVTELYTHCFTDGRDTNNEVCLDYLLPLENLMRELGLGKIGSIIGRFFAMDRDKRWNRVQKAYDLLVYGKGKPISNIEQAVRENYANGSLDEFFEPMVCVDENGQPTPRVQDGDTLIFFNFRSDRAREISHAFTDREFDFFDRGPNPPRTYFTCMTSYDDTLQDVVVAYPPHPPVNTLGRTLSKNGLRQLRIAETEKYAHVTFFFNGGVEKMEVGEDRVMIPSPNVKTYDLQPEMSAGAVTRAVIDRVESGIYDVIILNFANPDMVGHTGNVAATVQALEFIDQCLGQVAQAIREAGRETGKEGGTLIVTADHGNVERMIDENGQPMTSHTTNRVPLILVDDDLRHLELREGELDDIAPTMLQLLGLKQPAEMTGETLILSGLQQYDQPSLFSFD